MLSKKDIILFKNRYLDPNLLFIYNGKLHRLVENSTQEGNRWGEIQKFVKSKEFNKLIELRYIPGHKITDLKLAEHTSSIIYEVEEIQHQTYCWEWTRAQVVDALKLVCKINIELLKSNSKFLATDCGTHQVTFNKYNPIFMDIGSFTNIMPDLGVSNIMNECKKYKINCDFESALKNKGLKLWEGLLVAIENAKYSETPNKWDDYNKRPQPKSVDEIKNQIDAEARLILKWLGETKNCKTIADIGSNDGYFAYIFATNGYDIMAIDNCAVPIARLYKNVKKLKLNITPCYRDVMKSESMVWHDWRNRAKSDIAFGSSVTHHLARAGFGFDKQAQMWNKIADKYLIVEYIDRVDKHIKEWKLDVNYTYQGFIKSLSNDWIIKDQHRTEDRYWFFMERKQKRQSGRIWA